MARFYGWPKVRVCQMRHGWWGWMRPSWKGCNCLWKTMSNCKFVKYYILTDACWYLVHKYIYFVWSFLCFRVCDDLATSPTVANVVRVYIFICCFVFVAIHINTLHFYLYTLYTCIHFCYSMRWKFVSRPIICSMQRGIYLWFCKFLFLGFARPFNLIFSFFKSNINPNSYLLRSDYYLTIRLQIF